MGGLVLDVGLHVAHRPHILTAEIDVSRRGLHADMKNFCGTFKLKKTQKTPLNRDEDPPLTPKPLPLTVTVSLTDMSREAFCRSEQ